MRTSVTTKDDGTDEFPNCFGNVTEDGGLELVERDESTIEARYEPDEWSSFETVNEDKE